MILARRHWIRLIVLRMVGTIQCLECGARGPTLACLEHESKFEVVDIPVAVHVIAAYHRGYEILRHRRVEGFDDLTCVDIVIDTVALVLVANILQRHCQIESEALCRK